MFCQPSASVLFSSSSAYESQVTIKTLVQSETIGKTKIPSFLCKSSLCTTLASEQVTSDHVYVRVHEFPAPPIRPAHVNNDVNDKMKLNRKTGSLK